MKLDRNINPDGRGRYALIQMRELGDEEAADLRRFAGSDLDVEIPCSAIRTGAEGPGEQFFVLKYKDTFAAAALEAYAQAVDEFASHLWNEGEHDDCESFREFAQEIYAEADKAREAGRKTPTPLREAKDVKPETTPKEIK